MLRDTLGIAKRLQGDYDAALARHEQALAIHEDVDNPLGTAIAQSAMTAVFRVRGDLTRAESYALETISRAEARRRGGAEAQDHPGLMADANMQLAQVESARADHAVAAIYYRQAGRLFDTVGELGGVRSADEGLARQFMRSGNLEGRRSHHLCTRIQCSGS